MTVLVRAGGLTGYSQFSRSIGLNPVTMLDEAGLSEDEIKNPNTYIPYDKLIIAMELPSLKYGVTDFGLQFSKFQDLAFLGALSVAMKQTETAYDALHLTSKYLSYHTSGAGLTLTQSDDPRHLIASFHLHFRPPTQPIQVVERSVAYLQKLTNNFGVNSVTPLDICFMHDRLSPEATYRDVFGMVPTFGATMNGVILDIAELKHAKRIVDKNQKTLAEQFLASSGATPTSISDQALDLTRRLLPFKSVSLDELCDAMDMHKRTLQRALKADGTSFGKIRDQARKELAHSYLEQPRIPLSQVADLLGFSDQAVLTRACHKWFGRTPQTVRNELQQPGQHRI